MAVLRQAMNRVPNANWGLAVGAGDARVLVPLTADGEALAARLSDPGLERWVAPGSNLALLLANAGSLLPGGGPGRVILLVSDGEELDGDASAVADALRQGGIAIVPLVSGTTGGGPVPRPDGQSGVSYARDKTGALVRSRARPELMGRLGGDPGRAVDASSSAHRAPLRRHWLGQFASPRARWHPSTPHRSCWRPHFLRPGRFCSGPGAAPPSSRCCCRRRSGPPAPPVHTPSIWQRVVPGSASVLEHRAARAAARGDWEEARRAYAEATALRPRDDVLRLGLATAQAHEGEPAGEQALAELANSPRLAFPAWYNLGTARLLRGDFAGAAEALRRAVAADPKRFDAWHNLELALLGVAREVGRPIPSSDRESRERLVGGCSPRRAAAAGGPRVVLLRHLIGEGLVMRRALHFAIALLVPVALTAQAVQPQARFAPGTIPGTLRYQVVIEGAGRGEISGVLGQLDNLEVLAGPVLSQQVTWRGDQAVAVTALTWVVRARKLGPIAVGPTTVRFGDEEAVTNPVHGTALAGGHAAGETPRPELRVDLSRSRLLVGEPLVVRFFVESPGESLTGGWEVQASFPESWSERLPLEDIAPGAANPEAVHWAVGS